MDLYLICEDSLEGVFSAIYEAYLTKRPREDIHIQVGEEENVRLFAEYEHVTAEAHRAAKVARTIRQKFGDEGYMTICRALAAADGEKGEAIFRMVEQGLSLPNPRQMLEKLTDRHVMKVFELARGSGNESHHLLGFLRFRELESGLLYAPCAPKNNVLTFVMGHFADRMPEENFIIHDEARGLFGLHPARKRWFVVRRDEGFSIDGATQAYSEAEFAYSELFKTFFHGIAITERENYKLQRNNLPLCYREYMTEF